MRLILAIVVTVMQVAGPWLCCCGPARVIAAAPAMPLPDRATPPAAGCPVCAKLSAEKAVSAAVPAKPVRPFEGRAFLAGDRDRQSPPLPEPCPCGGVTLEVAAPAVLDPSDSLGEFAAALAFPVLAPLELFVRLVPEPRPPHLSDVPFLPPGVRTRVHHVLHC